MCFNSSSRCWWLVGFGLSLCFCGIAIHKTYVKWTKHPTTLSLVEQAVPISKIPFPTITICPETKTSKDKLDLVSIYHALENSQKENLTDLEWVKVEFFHFNSQMCFFWYPRLSRMEALVHICQFSEHKATVCDHFGNRFINESVFKLIREMAPSGNESLTYCKWQDKKYPCMELFKPFFSEKGICFAFNALNSRDIYTEVWVFCKKALHEFGKQCQNSFPTEWHRKCRSWRVTQTCYTGVEIKDIQMNCTKLRTQYAYLTPIPMVVCSLFYVSANVTWSIYAVDMFMDSKSSSRHRVNHSKDHDNIFAFRL